MPSDQMIIRRYRSTSEGKKRQLSTYFREGLFCNHLPEFSDENEGILARSDENGYLRGLLRVQTSSLRRRRGEKETPTLSDKEYDQAFHQLHQDARHQFFANSWRMGTDVNETMWKCYAQADDMVKGCAVETTLGQFVYALSHIHPLTHRAFETLDLYDKSELPIYNVSLHSKNCDVRVGACRYQDRLDEASMQPDGLKSSVAFFKGSDFDDENEFRLLLNPFSSNTLFETDSDQVPSTFRPDVQHPKYRKYPLATEWITNRIVLSPNATTDDEERVSEWLEEFGATTGSSLLDDIDIVRSDMQGSLLTRTHDYIAELGGLDNYDRDLEYYTEIADGFLDKREWDDWPVVDIVYLHTDTAGMIVEAYWHATDPPTISLDEYGHDDYQSVWAIRYRGPGTETTVYQNDRAEASDDLRIRPVRTGSRRSLLRSGLLRR